MTNGFCEELFHQSVMRNKRQASHVLLLSILVFSSAVVSVAQRGTPVVSRSAGFTIFGDLAVTGAGVEERPLTFDLMLYSRTGVLLDRQRIGSKGRYRFNNVPQGDYDVVVEFENREVSRTHIKLNGMLTDFRQDIALEWHSGPIKPAKPPVISAEDLYDRKSPNKDRFEKAEEAFDKKDYDKAVDLLRQVVADDPQDFQAWSELGTVYLVQKNLAEAEKSYLRATEVRPAFFRALLNLGRLRLRLKNYDGAVTALEQAVAAQPKSAEANYFLGEGYLQIKKGSKAVGYLNEALKLDPIGMADAHLRLAALYHGAGMKDKAAAEYEQFLKKKPDYADKKKLEQYIADNKKQ
jgi:tetratricopeptide (TPR) repeat protein